MGYQQSDLKVAENEILEQLLGTGPIYATELISRVTGKGVRSHIARGAIWHLVDVGQVKFNDNRKFEALNESIEST